MNYINNNIRDISKFIKMFIFNLSLSVALIFYFNVELSMQATSIEKELVARGELLGVNLLKSAGLMDSIVDKMALFGMIVIFLLVWSTIYSALTYDRFMPGIISTIINSVLSFMTIYLPLSNNVTDISTNMKLYIVIIPFVVGILTFIIIYLIGKAIDFVFFGGKVKRMRMVSIPDYNPEDYMDEDDEDDNYDEYSEYEGDFEDNKTKSGRKRLKNRKKNNKNVNQYEEYYEYEDDYCEEPINHNEYEDNFNGYVFNNQYLNEDTNRISIKRQR